jgi:hypothetical protein
MCTVTLVAQKNGYRLAMNRDERVARGAGTAPEAHKMNGIRVIYPNDGTGGTWIGTNEYGIALALLNWNQPPPSTRMEFESRGQVIPALLSLGNTTGLQAAASVLDLDRTRPFRLVGIFPAEEAIVELRWNSQNLEGLSHAWESQHWFSSGLSDEEAMCSRSRTCSEARTEPIASSSDWLRRLHASHNGGPAFSLCVHRGEVATLSYTEVSCSSESVALEHFVGSPCAMKPCSFTEVRRLPAPLLRPNPFTSLLPR